MNKLDTWKTKLNDLSSAISSKFYPKKFFLGQKGDQVALVSKKGKEISIEYLGQCKNNRASHWEDVRLSQITALSLEEVLVRTISLKIKSKKEKKAALPFQIENLLSIDPKELFVLPNFERKDPISLLITKKEQIALHLSAQNIDPDILASDAQGLVALATYLHPNEPSFFILYAKGPQWTILAIEQGFLISSHSFEKGEKDQILNRMKVKFPKIEKIFSISHEPPKTPFIPLKSPPKTWVDFALPLGLALYGSNKKTPNFRTSKTKKEIRLQKKNLQLFSTACATFCLCLILVGGRTLDQKERFWIDALKIKSSSLEKGIAQLRDNVYQSKGSKIPLSTHQRPSSVIDYLSNHPHLGAESSIDKLSYTVEDLPRLKNQRRQAKVKIELELTSSDSKKIRQFHNSLLKDKEWIDQTRGIKWSNNQGRVCTCFYLRPKRG